MKHQVKVFEQSREAEAFALLMEQGTGKSKVIVDTAAWLYMRGKIDGVLVIAPKGVYINWVGDEETEFEKHCPGFVPFRSALWNSTPNKRQAAALKEILYPLHYDGGVKLDVLVMNVEALRTKKGVDFARAFLMTHKVLMLVDESNTIGNMKAIQTKNIIKLGGMAPYRRILSGTAPDNSPLDLFSMFWFLDKDILGYNSFFAFKTRFCVLKRIQLATHAFDQVVNYRDLDQLRELIAPASFRVTKKECLDLPDKIYQKHWFALTGEQLRVYNDMKDLSIAELSKEDRVTANMVITRLLRLQQIASGFVHADNPDGPIDKKKIKWLVEPRKAETNPRMTALLEVIAERDSSRAKNDKGKFIIWTNHRLNVELVTWMLNEKFGPGSAAAYYGGVKDDERKRIMRSFQDPESPLRYFVGNPQTAGFGLTLTQADTVIYYTNSYDLIHRGQSEDRAHRIGQKKNVLYIDLLAEDTVDVKILKALRKKKEVSSQVTGDGWKEWI